MPETKSEATSVVLGQRFLEWLRQRVDETSERGSIYIGIEKHRVTWVNYEGNHRLLPPGPDSSSDETKRPGPCLN